MKNLVLICLLAQTVVACSNSNSSHETKSDPRVELVKSTIQDQTYQFGKSAMRVKSDGSYEFTMDAAVRYFLNPESNTDRSEADARCLLKLNGTANFTGFQTVTDGSHQAMALMNISISSAQVLSAEGDLEHPSKIKPDVICAGFADNAMKAERPGFTVEEVSENQLVFGSLWLGIMKQKNWEYEASLAERFNYNPAAVSFFGESGRFIKENTVAVVTDEFLSKAAGKYIVQGEGGLHVEILPDQKAMTLTNVACGVAVYAKIKSVYLDKDGLNVNSDPEDMPGPKVQLPLNNHWLDCGPNIEAGLLMKNQITKIGFTVYGKSKTLRLFSSDLKDRWSMELQKTDGEEQ